MINVLFITVRADFGGGPQHIDLLINNLPENINIYIACPDDKPYFEKWKNGRKIKGIFLIPHRKFEILKLLKLFSFVRKNKINIVHSHGKGAGVYSRLLKISMPKLKIIHTFHGLHIKQYNFFKKIIYLNAEKIFSIFTNIVINVSHGEQKDCLEFKLFNPKKSIVIHNGIVPLEKMDKNEAKNFLGIKNKFVISTISRFDYAKNMFLAYEIAKLFQDKPDLVFVWIGDGENKLELEKLAKKAGLDNIIFAGFRTDIPKYLNATDIYLSTSRWEGLPIALLEAMSLGIPIVATDVVGNNEVVHHSLNGFLYTTTQEAVKYLNILMSNSIQFSEFQHNATKLFYEKFHISKMINKLLFIYNKMNHKF